ncbi:hypothetical protein D3C80_1229490 [compost metagenome]
MPNSAPRPAPTISAVGVARPRAQGQAITSTATLDSSPTRPADSSASTQGSQVVPHSRRPRSDSPQSSQMARLARLMSSTTGTKRPVMRSANSWIGTLVLCACSTRSITWARKVSWPTLVARTCSRPSLFRVAPITASPGPFSFGSDSPVARDSSTWLRPSTTSPSLGIFSPGRTSIRSPTTTASIGTCSSTPSRSSTALLAPNSSILRMAWEARPLARASR